MIFSVIRFPCKIMLFNTLKQSFLNTFNKLYTKIILQNRSLLRFLFWINNTQLIVINQHREKFKKKKKHTQHRPWAELLCSSVYRKTPPVCITISANPHLQIYRTSCHVSFQLKKAKDNWLPYAFYKEMINRLLSMGHIYRIYTRIPLGWIWPKVSSS